MNLHNEQQKYGVLAASQSNREAIIFAILSFPRLSE